MFEQNSNGTGSQFSPSPTEVLTELKAERSFRNKDLYVHKFRFLEKYKGNYKAFIVKVPHQTQRIFSLLLLEELFKDLWCLKSPLLRQTTILEPIILELHFAGLAGKASSK